MGVCNVLKLGLCGGRANARHEGNDFNTGRGFSCLGLPLLEFKEQVTHIYLLDSLVSTSPGLLHNLVDDGAGPLVSPWATVLHRLQVSDQVSA